MGNIEWWRGEYSRRFIERVAIRRPPEPPVYVRLTDEQIESLPESMRKVARARRDINDLLTALAESAAKIIRGEPL